MKANGLALMGARLPKRKQSEGAMKKKKKMRRKRTSSSMTMTMSPPNHRRQHPRSFSPPRPRLLQSVDAVSLRSEDKGEAVAEEEEEEGVRMLLLVRL